MNRMLLSLALTLLSSGNAAPPPPTSTLLMPGRVAVELLAPVYAPATAAIMRKMATATQANAEWYEAQLRNAQPGEPLAYDAQFGVTREEYQQVLTAQPTYTAYARSVLTISRQGDGTLLLQGGRGLEGINRVAVDVQRNRVRTPYGWTDVGEPLEYAATDNLGPRAGQSWLYEKGDLDQGNITTVRLSVLRLEKTGQTLMSFRSVQIVNRQPLEDVNVTFTFPMQRGPAKP